MTSAETYQDDKRTSEPTALERLYGPGTKIVNGVLVLSGTSNPEKRNPYENLRPTDPQF